jgi:hypothetical protein
MMRHEKYVAHHTECIQISIENLKGRDHLQDLGVKKEIKAFYRTIGCKGLEWIQLSSGESPVVRFCDMIMNIRLS